MQNLTKNRRFYTTTETSGQYIDHGRPDPHAAFRPSARDKLVEADLLIYEKFFTNLHLQPGVREPKPELPVVRRMVIPVPQSLPYPEYAKQFVDKYPRHFCAKSTDYVRWMLSNRYRSVYEMDYAYGKEKQRDQNTLSGDQYTQSRRLPSNWLMDTTYQSSYRRMDNIPEVGKLKRADSYKPAAKVDKLQQKLRDIFKFGRSEYTGRICDEAEIALELHKYGPTVRRGYFDRYTKEKRTYFASSS